jgi:YYY domain-containing protein
VLLDWFVRELGIVLSWWGLVTLCGVAAFPLCLRLLGGLPDKGYTLSRAAGLLLVGFVYWLLGSLGFVRNLPGSVILAWLIVLVIALAAFYRSGTAFDWRGWWKENWRVILSAEVLFLVLLLGWSIYRAHQNGLIATEKPMDLAFMSASLRSETFPPNDPWMSGYAISYYYFGYLMAGMLSMMSGVHTTIGFNMTNALLFALTGLTVFGVVYNLVRSRAFHRDGSLLDRASPHWLALVAGVMGMVFTVLMGNFQAALIEIPYQTASASDAYLQFWDTQDREFTREFPVDMFSPQNAAQINWWWFRASRIIHDRDLNGQPIGIQPIDEFPQFSFLLADNHPHVLALPFAALALGLALNLLLTWRNPTQSEIVFYGVCIGGLIFLNTWDGPIYLFMLVGADALRRLMRNGTGRLRGSDWLGIAGLGAEILFLGVILYLPFLISFRSQASGILPNILYPTLFRQYFIMFGPFILILVPFLILEAIRAGGRMNWKLGLQTALTILGGLLLVMFLLVVVGSLVPELRGIVLNYIDQNGGWGSALPAILTKRLSHSLLALLLLAGILLVVGRLFPRARAGDRAFEDENRQVVEYPAANGFALLVVGAALVLTLVPEFIYLRDNFAVRINTIFKFYYQAWLMFSVASAYALYTLLSDSEQRTLPAPVRAAVAGIASIGITLGMVYPALGIHNRMFIETGRAAMSEPAALTLDGGRTFAAANDYNAIMCLKNLVEGDDVVIAEAIGPAYRNEYGRVGALTGLPIVLGWENHEGQWRGATYGQIVGTRPQDIPQLYQDLRWDKAQEIITRYGIDYVFYGNTERADYGTAGEDKFRENAEAVCESGGSVFYRVESLEIAAR